MSTPPGSGGPADLAVSLPTDTRTFSSVGMLPVGRLDDHHLLVLADDVAPDEVESLAVSLDENAGWVGASRLQIAAGAELHGPWDVDAPTGRLLGLPEWVSQLWLLECPRQRAGALPAELAGVDPLSDAFPLAQPAGIELLALTRLRSIARRLAGGLRLAGDAPSSPVLLVPDPELSTGLSVYAPVWISPDGLVSALAEAAPGVTPVLEPTPSDAPTGLEAVPESELGRLVDVLGEEALDRAWREAQARRAELAAREAAAAAAGEVIEEVRDGYAVVAPVDAEHPAWGEVEVRVLGAEALPVAVRGEPWARGGVVVYASVWMPRDPADAHAENPSRATRRARQAARERIEAVATVLVGAAEGVAVDEDGFLVALQ